MSDLPEMVVRAFIEAMNRKDWAAWADLLHDDVRYTLQGIDLPGAGTMDKATVTRTIPQVVAAMWDDHSPTLTIEHVLSDGDWVAVEAAGGGALRDGSPYENHYALFYEVRDGKVVTLREYFDTQHTALLFERLGVAS